MPAAAAPAQAGSSEESFFGRGEASSVISLPCAELQHMHLLPVACAHAPVNTFSAVQKSPVQPLYTLLRFHAPGK